MKKMLRIIFAIFPLNGLLFLGLGIYIHLNNPHIFSIWLILIGSIISCSKTSIIIHEVGHLFFGKLVGGRPKKIILGNEMELTRFSLFGVRIHVSSNIKMAYAIVDLEKVKPQKFRFALFYLGGVIFNLVVALSLAIMLFPFREIQLSALSVNIILPVIFYNFYLVITNLIPFTTSRSGVKHKTDGKQFLELLKNPLNQIEIINDLDKIYLAEEFAYQNNYKKAIELQFSVVKKNPDSINQKVSLSGYLIGGGRIKEGLNILDDLLNEETQNKQFDKIKNVIFNNYAWGSYISGDIETATKYAGKYSEYSESNPYFRGTQGAIFIANNMLEKGISLVSQNMDTSFVNNVTLNAALQYWIYFNQKNEKEKAKKYIEFLKKNEGKMSKDIEQLYQSLLTNNTTTRLPE
ncbi:MAG: hypothetical protein MK078_09840 [Crocinitomicaceae bacterium]|nr:hypothetical protein [Crocinitomicaceae bacterium]